jgi:CrcB protein
MRDMLAVFVGGVIGTALRLIIDRAIQTPDAAFPTATLAINVLGSFVLGLLTTAVWPTARPWVRAGLGPGVLGSFTTFSALAVGLVGLVDSDQPLVAALYLAVTVIGGFGAAMLGLTLPRLVRRTT